MKFRIKEICREKGIMLKDLAKQINITEDGLYKSLNGNPTINRLEEIAVVLGVSVTDLFEKKGSSIVCPNCGEKINITVSNEK